MNRQTNRMNRLLLIPFLTAALGNGTVFSQAQTANVRIDVDASRIENRIPDYLYGACMEDVNHEVYGGIYNQRIFGESFEEPTPGMIFDDFSIYEGVWSASQGELDVKGTGGSKFVYNPVEMRNGSVEVEIKFDGKSGDNAGLITRVSKEAKGADTFNGYEISLASNGRKVAVGRHEHNFGHIRDIKVDCHPTEWNRLKVAACVLIL